MRQHTHDCVARFRVNTELLSAAEEKARREGMSVSELLRAALRREVREAA